MAKLYFRYGAMNSGKSTLLLQVAYNYEERGMHVLLLKPGIDTKGDDEIVSRLGVRRRVDRTITKDTDCRVLVQEEIKKRPIDCILVDEAQFLSRQHVEQLFVAVMDADIPCICYGLRTDFRGEGFPGSQRLLELAHSLEELKTICHCGRKAIMNIRRVNGQTVFEGDQVCIDNNATLEYEAVCGQCFLAERRKRGEVPLASLYADFSFTDEKHGV